MRHEHSSHKPSTTPRSPSRASGSRAGAAGRAAAGGLRLTRSDLARTSSGFDDVVWDQLRRTPWVGASIAFHGVVIGLLLLMPSAPPEAPPAPTVIAQSPPVDHIDLEDPPAEEPDPKHETPEFKREDSEALPTEVVDEKSRTDDDVPFDETLGDPRFESMAAFDAHATNAVIGVGPGAGGAKGFGGRGGNADTNGGGRPGGGTQPAVNRGLTWLARHQSPSGGWDCDGFTSQCKHNDCGGTGDAVHDVGVTGLAMLAFLANGNTHKHGEFKENVRRGARFLITAQDAEGCIGERIGNGYQYSHSIATMALAELYGMTNSQLFREPAQRAVNFVHRSQNPYLAWRYGVRDGDNDTSVTGWMVMALKSARTAGLEVDEGSFRSAIAWVDKMTEPEFGRVGYQRRGGPPARTAELTERFPAEQTESLTAVGVLTRIFAGQDPHKTEAIDKGVKLMLKRPPRWDIDAGTIDMYYWYYGTLALHQIGGAPWKEWNRSMKSAIVDHQRLEAGRDEHGSWDPVGPWGVDGGRVYSTAVMTLCLQVYYRYERVF